MTLAEAIKEYREPTYGLVSNVKNPGDRSCDNGLLFSATYIVLLDRAPEQYAELVWFIDIIRKCSIENGVYARYPGEKTPTTHDDLTGIVSIGRGTLASLGLYFYLNMHDWFYPAEGSQVSDASRYGNLLARIVDFPATVRAAATVKLTTLSKVGFCLGLLWNCFEKKSETSGKCLIYLKARTVEKSGSRICNLTVWIWRRVQAVRYTGGMRDVYAIYFGPEHPFAVYGPRDFK